MAEPVVSTEDFETFYRRAWRDAARWATALTGDQSIGEEIAQEARSAEVAGHLSQGDGGIHLGDDVSKAFYRDIILQALGISP